MTQKQRVRRVVGLYVLLIAVAAAYSSQNDRLAYVMLLVIVLRVATASSALIAVILVRHASQSEVSLPDDLAC